MIYDITQELFSSVTYPGDTSPEQIAVKRMAEGDLYNLTDMKMCVHNGTHIDAPLHFVRNGKGIDSISIDTFVGRCRVVSTPDSLLCADDERLLLRGTTEIDLSMAQKLCEKKIKLLGIEGQSVGGVEVHKALLAQEIVLLEGIRLDDVPDGVYFLFAAPLKLAECDGAPCRAILIDDVN